MDPASSSDDDSEIEEAPSRSRNLIPQNDDDGSSSAPSSSSEDDDDDDDSSIEQGKNSNTNFDDLPSEDSCMEDDSDEDGDDYNAPPPPQEEEEQEQDMSLADRIYSKKNDGTRSLAKERADKKTQALALAQKRLSEMKRKRNENNSDSDDSDSDSDSDGDDNDDNNDPKKKKSKHAPTIASSSRKAYFQRGAPDLNSSGLGVAVGANKYKPRDPRMQSLSGFLDQNVFEKRYEFLEQVQSDEIDKMKERVKAWKVTGGKGNKLRRKLGMTDAAAGLTEEGDEEELKRLVQERSSRRDAKMRTAAKSAVKKKVRDEVAAGNRGAYHLKKRELKELELEARFDQLRKKGGDSAVNKVMAKRRKRKMGKDSGLMPKASGGY